MEGIQEQIEKIQSEVERLDRRDYSKKLKLLEKLIEHYQSLEDIEAEFKCRMRAVYNACYSDIEKMFLHFSWVQTFYDAHIDEIKVSSKIRFFYLYKKVLENAIGSEFITVDQIDELFMDLLDRAKNTEIELSFDSYIKHLKSTTRTERGRLSPIYYAAWSVFASMGYKEKAQKYYDFWIEEHDLKGYALGPCSSCCIHQVIYEEYRELNFEKVIEEGEKLVNNDEIYRCGYVVPSSTYSLMCHASLSLGKYDEAKEYFEKALQTIDSTSLEIICWYIYHDELTLAVSEYEKYLGKYYKNISSYKLTCFFIGYLLFSKVTTDKIKIFFPEEMEIFKANHEYEVEKLKSYFQNNANELIKKFDERNQNNHLSNYYKQLETIYTS